MTAVRIKVSGPGGLVAAPAEQIKRTLEALGAGVTMTTNAPNEHIGYPEVTSLAGWEVHLEVDHQPWGG